MNNSISIYNFNQNSIRTTTVDSEPWFCLSDVCAALKVKQCRIDRLSEHGLIKNQLTDTLGRVQESYFINEPNLYRLIFRSNKPQAQAFADWVYSEVLPAIRKAGYYGTPAVTDNKEALKTLGGIVKRCTAAAVREELEALTKCNNDATVKLTAMLFENAINDRVQHQLKDKLNKINALLAE